jgi:hypothetical protein
VWSIVIDSKIDVTYRVMKKGKQVMQIPIQSLNSKHAKKFSFDFNESTYHYYLADEDLDDIELVLASGERFTLSKANSGVSKKKRDYKMEEK